MGRRAKARVRVLKQRALNMVSCGKEDDNCKGLSYEITMAGVK